MSRRYGLGSSHLALALSLLCAAEGWPQEKAEEKPVIALPEPERKPRYQQGVFVLTALLYDQSAEGVDRSSAALPELVGFFKKATSFKTEVLWNERALNDPKFMEANLVYLTGSEAPLRLGEGEKKRLGEYLLSGGLLFAEDIRLNLAGGRRGFRGSAGVAGTPFDRQFKALMGDPLVLGSQGARWETVPHNYPLYSSYFDFPDGPPLAAAQGGNVEDLEVLQVRGRVAVIFSDLNISSYWGNLQAQGRERHLQFGVNLIVFAMTQQARGF